MSRVREGRQAMKHGVAGEWLSRKGGSKVSKRGECQSKKSVWPGSMEEDGKKNGQRRRERGEKGESEKRTRMESGERGWGKGMRGIWGGEESEEKRVGWRDRGGDERRSEKGGGQGRGREEGMEEGEEKTIK